MTAPKLTAPAVSAAVRRAIGAGNAKAQTRDQIEVEGQLVTASVWVTVHAGEDAACLAAGELLRAGYEVARTGTILTVVLPEPVEETSAAAEVIEADVPPTADERVTVPIRASELRPGDEVVDSLGGRQYAAFDVQAIEEPNGTSPIPRRVVKVWTAIRDQERGLPPVVRILADRELLVLRPLSEEGRELLAALDRP